MSEVHNEIAYGLGQRAHEAGLTGLPLDDGLFERFLFDNNHLPLITVLSSYIAGFEAAEIKLSSVVIDASDRFTAKQ